MNQSQKFMYTDSPSKMNSTFDPLTNSQNRVTQ